MARIETNMLANCLRVLFAISKISKISERDFLFVLGRNQLQCEPLSNASLGLRFALEHVEDLFFFFLKKYASGSNDDVYAS